MNKQMEIFSLNPPIYLSEEGKWILAVFFFEVTNCIFQITDKDNSFSVSISGRRRFLNYLEDGNIDKLNNLLNIKSQIDIELHVQEVRNRGNKKNFKEFSLSYFDTSKEELLEEFKKLIIMILKLW